jgi:hypothetical protein
MARFSITKLEEARNNPSKFAESLTSDSDNYYRYSKYMRWKNHAIKYHKEDDPAGVLNSLSDKLFENYKTIQKDSDELHEYLNKLQNYIDNFVNSDLIFLESRKRLRYSIGPNIDISGQIPIVALNSKAGYNLYFFDKESPDWQPELKYPFIQFYFADHVYSCNYSEISVGIYSLEEEEFQFTTYSDNEIQQALDELQEVGQKISNVIN